MCTICKTVSSVELHELEDGDSAPCEHFDRHDRMCEQPAAYVRITYSVDDHYCEHHKDVWLGQLHSGLAEMFAAFGLEHAQMLVPIEEHAETVCGYIPPAMPGTPVDVHLQLKCHEAATYAYMSQQKHFLCARHRGSHNVI